MKKIQLSFIKKNIQLISIAVLLGVIVGLIVQLQHASNFNIHAEKNDTASTASLRMSIAAQSISDATSYMSGEKIEGMKAVELSIEVKNASSQKQAFIPANQLFIKSSSGQIYQMSPISGLANPIVSGTLDTGELVSGSVGFLIDENAEGLWLFMDSRWDDSPAISLEL